jgi:hypothetical protein
VAQPLAMNTIVRRQPAATSEEAVSLFESPQSRVNVLAYLWTRCLAGMSLWSPCWCTILADSKCSNTQEIVVEGNRSRAVVPEGSPTDKARSFYRGFGEVTVGRLHHDVMTP